MYVQKASFSRDQVIDYHSAKTASFTFTCQLLMFRVIKEACLLDSDLFAVSLGTLFSRAASVKSAGYSH